MPNAFGNKRWTLDTAQTKPLLGITENIKVRRVQFKPAAATNALILKDKDGVTKETDTATAAASAGGTIEHDYGDDGILYRGMVLDTLSGGTVYVDLI